MNTEQAFKKMVEHNPEIGFVLNAMLEENNEAKELVKNTFCYACMMADTKRKNALAESVYNEVKYGKKMDAEAVLAVEITEDEIPAISKQFCINLLTILGA